MPALAIGARADTEIDGVLARAEGHDVRALLGLLGDRIVEPREQVPLLLDAIASAGTALALPTQASIVYSSAGEQVQESAAVHGSWRNGNA